MLLAFLFSTLKSWLLIWWPLRNIKCKVQIHPDFGLSSKYLKINCRSKASRSAELSFSVSLPFLLRRQNHLSSHLPANKRGFPRCPLWPRELAPPHTGNGLWAFLATWMSSLPSEPSEFAPFASILPSPRLMTLSPHLVGARAHRLLAPCRYSGEVSKELRAIYKHGRAQTLPTGKVKTPQHDTECKCKKGNRWWKTPQYSTEGKQQMTKILEDQEEVEEMAEIFWGTYMAGSERSSTNPMNEVASIPWSPVGDWHCPYFSALMLSLSLVFHIQESINSGYGKTQNMKMTHKQNKVTVVV